MPSADKSLQYLNYIQRAVSCGYAKVSERADQRRLETGATAKAASRKRKRASARKEREQEEKELREEFERAELELRKEAERAEQERRDKEVLEEAARRERARQRALEAKKVREAKAREARARMQEEREERFKRREEERTAEAANAAAAEEPAAAPKRARKGPAASAGRASGAKEQKLRPGKGKGSAKAGARTLQSIEDDEPIESLLLLEGADGPTNSLGPPSSSSAATSTSVDTPDQREKVREKLREALVGAVDEDEDDLLRPPESLALEIEAALFSHFGLGKEYLGHSRSIVFNVRDRKNPSFRQKLLSGRFRPQDLPCMTPEDMASEAKAAERAKFRQEASEAAAVKATDLVPTDAFTCEKCLSTSCASAQSQAVESCIRTGGEPKITSVAYVVCLSCNFRWTDRSGLG